MSTFHMAPRSTIFTAAQVRAQPKGSQTAQSRALYIAPGIGVCSTYGLEVLPAPHPPRNPLPFEPTETFCAELSYSVKFCYRWARGRINSFLQHQEIVVEIPTSVIKKTKLLIMYYDLTRLRACHNQWQSFRSSGRDLPKKDQHLTTAWRGRSLVY